MNFVISEDDSPTTNQEFYRETQMAVSYIRCLYIAILLVAVGRLILSPNLKALLYAFWSDNRKNKEMSRESRLEPVKPKGALTPGQKKRYLVYYLSY